MLERRSPPRGVLVADRFDRVGGHVRLYKALYAIALDSVYPQARDELRRDDYDWLVDAVGGAVEHSTNEAMRILNDELGDVLEDAPSSLRADLDRLKAREELGCE